jgi:hypothetical protein
MFFRRVLRDQLAEGDAKKDDDTQDDVVASER